MRKRPPADAGYGRQQRTPATTAAIPVDQTGQAPTAAPSTTSEAPMTVRTSERSGPSRPGSGSLVADPARRRGAPVEPQAGEPHPEERAAPLGDELGRRLAAPELDRVGDVGGRVPRLGERVGELLELRAGPLRLDEPVGALAGDVEGVAKPRQLLGRVVRTELLRGPAGDRLQPDERAAQVAPEPVELARGAPTFPAAHPGRHCCRF